MYVCMYRKDSTIKNVYVCIERVVQSEMYACMYV